MDNLVQVSFTVIALLSRAAAEHDLSLTQLRALRKGRSALSCIGVDAGVLPRWGEGKEE